MAAFELDAVRLEEVAVDDHSDHPSKWGAILRVSPAFDPSTNRATLLHMALVNPAHFLDLQDIDGARCTCLFPCAERLRAEVL